MADDNPERRLDPEATAAPNRDKRGQPPIIEGEATRHDEPAAGQEAPQVEAPPSEQPPDQSQPGASARRPLRPFLAAAIGGLAGAIVAAAGFWLQTSGLDARLKERVAALETPVEDLTHRVGALESSTQNVKATADTVKAAQNDAAKALALATKTASSLDQNKSAPVASAADVKAIDERLKKLESAPPPAPPQQAQSAADLSAIEDRLAKLEAALAAPKSETRAAPENAPDRKDWTGLAVAAEAVSGRLASGAPYPAEEGALERLGADPAKIAVLKPFADKGAPTATTLASGFAKVAQDALNAATPKEGGGVMDRLMSDMSKVVKITPVGEVAGDDPAALVSQISAALDRGDIAGAAALWARLPEPARQASQSWGAALQARLAADAAAQGVLNDAMTKLALSDKQ